MAERFCPLFWEQIDIIDFAYLETMNLGLVFYCHRLRPSNPETHVEVLNQENLLLQNDGDD